MNYFGPVQGGEAAIRHHRAELASILDSVLQDAASEHQAFRDRLAAIETEAARLRDAIAADDDVLARLTTLARAVRLSRRTLGIVKQNIAFSLAIKAVFLVLAVGGWATLWMAVGADMGGSLLVVANGLRARQLDR